MAAPTRIDSLTGLRFFAALLVFGYHSLHIGGRSGEGGFEIFAAGMTGVSFFYIVSGFVMGWSARTGDRPWDFYRRRFARIYPSYFVVWAGTLLLSALSGEAIGVTDFIPITLMQSWVPADAVYFATSAVFWSLSCEAFFYAVFPWIFPALSRLSTRGCVILLAGIVAVIFGLAALVAPAFGSEVAFWALTIFPPTRVLEFVAGILLALLMKAGWKSPVPLWGAGVFAVAAFLAAPFAPESFVRVAVTLVPFILLVWAAASVDLAGKRSVLRSPVLVRLGVWSYGFYLVHTQVMGAWFRVLDLAGVGPLAGVPLLLAQLGALVLAVAASALLYRLVERPAERALRPTRTVSALAP